MKTLITILAVIGLGFSLPSMANSTSYSDSNTVGHSGGTDSSGCHTNRKTGGYHCH
jgi:hypothetical protein